MTKNAQASLAEKSSNMSVPRFFPIIAAAISELSSVCSTHLLFPTESEHTLPS